MIDLPQCEMRVEVQGVLFCRHDRVHATGNIVRESHCLICREREVPCKRPRDLTATNEDQMRGAGDLVARFAQPVAKAIDAVAGTNIAGCLPCKERQEKLNEILPFDHPDRPKITF